MTDIDLLLYIQDLTETLGHAPTQAAIIAAIKTEEEVDFAGFTQLFDGDFVGRLTALCDKGLASRTYREASYQYECLPAGLKLLKKQFG